LFRRNQFLLILIYQLFIPTRYFNLSANYTKKTNSTQIKTNNIADLDDWFIPASATIEAKMGH
jgi:hypothetical protein